jgi:hypothetical protein
MKISTVGELFEVLVHFSKLSFQEGGGGIKLTFFVDYLSTLLLRSLVGESSSQLKP